MRRSFSPPWKRFVFLGPLSVLLLCMFCWMPFNQWKEASDNVAIQRGDPNWDVKALAALVALMQRQPNSRKYAVRWNGEEEKYAEFSYSAEQQKLAYLSGANWKNDYSLLNDTYVEISRGVLEIAVVKEMRYCELVSGKR